MGEYRRDRNLNGGAVMIVTKDCYNITDFVLQTTTQNETELVWVTITLKDMYVTFGHDVAILSIRECRLSLTIHLRH